MKHGEILGIFPEGTKKQNRRNFRCKTWFGYDCNQGTKPIIPMAIIGNYKPFSKIKIKIGKPIELTNYYNKKLSTRISKLSQDVLDIIKNLMI